MKLSKAPHRHIPAAILVQGGIVRQESTVASECGVPLRPVPADALPCDGCAAIRARKVNRAA